MSREMVTMPCKVGSPKATTFEMSRDFGCGSGNDLILQRPHFLIASGEFHGVFYRAVREDALFDPEEAFLGELAPEKLISES